MLFDLINEVNLQMYNSLVIAVINIPLCIYFSKNLNMGSAGVMIGQICTMVPFSIIMTLKTYSVLNKKEQELGM